MDGMIFTTKSKNRNMKKISILMGLILAAVFLLGNVTKKAIQYNYIHDEDESGDIIGQETLKYM